MSKTTQTIRVLIADDHLMVRMGLRMMLHMSEHIELVGEADNGSEAVRLAGELQPDVVLLDLRMPEMDGLEALAQIRRNWPQIAVLILTTYNEDELMVKGLRAGAAGYLLKDTTLEMLLHAIEATARGEMLLQPEVMERLLAQAAQGTRTPTTAAPEKPRKRNRDELTERELEVLATVARGARNKEIAALLGVSERTVWAYLTSIYTKLNVESRTAAVAVARERGLLP
jgi:NarL family two-component system response regulator YdfI